MSYSPCPFCGGVKVSRERRPNGDTSCWGCGMNLPSVEWDARIAAHSKDTPKADEAVLTIRAEYEALRESWEEEKARVSELIDRKATDPWLWIGDGTDDPETLACPVLMSADQARDLHAKLEAAEKRAEEAQALAEKLQARAEEAAMHLRGCEFWAFTGDRTEAAKHLVMMAKTVAKNYARERLKNQEALERIAELDQWKARVSRWLEGYERQPGETLIHVAARMGDLAFAQTARIVELEAAEKKRNELQEKLEAQHGDDGCSGETECLICRGEAGEALASMRFDDGLGNSPSRSRREACGGGGTGRGSKGDRGSY